MKFLGNILWLILGGLLVSLYYFVVGLLFCVTIIGIPFGYQLMKLGVFALWPFGHEAVFGQNEPGCLALLMNIIWVIVGGWEIALMHLVFGAICCITIVGIPFGLQHFKMTRMAFLPFGTTIS